MVKQTKKAKDLSLKALHLFKEQIRIYTATDNWFETFCKVKYTYGALEMHEDCHIDVSIVNPIGRIKISGGRIQEGFLPTEFRPTLDVFEFVNNALVIRGSKDKQFTVEIGEYAEGSRIIPD